MIVLHTFQEQNKIHVYPEALCELLKLFWEFFPFVSLQHPLPTTDDYGLVIGIAAKYISSAVSPKAAQWLIWSVSPHKFLSFPN